MKKVPHFQPSLEGSWIQDTEGISYQPLRATHTHPSLLPLPRPGFLRRELKCAIPCTVWGKLYFNTQHDTFFSPPILSCSLFLNNPRAFTLHMSKGSLNHEDVLKRLEILVCFGVQTPTVITCQCFSEEIFTSVKSCSFVRNSTFWRAGGRNATCSDKCRTCSKNQQMDANKKWKKKKKENPTQEITLNTENKPEFIPRTEKRAFQKHR